MTEKHIFGGQELAKLLQTLPVKLEKNIMRAALAAGARVIAQEAKANAPVGKPSNVAAEKYGAYPGALRDSVRVTSRFTRDGKATASVKAGGKAKKGAKVFYAHMVEFGTGQHLIRPRAKKALQMGGQIVRGEVMHPGVRPRPFMRPAADGKLAEATAAVTNYIRARLKTEGVDVPAPAPGAE